MRVRVRFSGGLGRQFPSNPLAVMVPDNATVGDVIDALGLRRGDVWLAKLKDELVAMDRRLEPEEELVLIPPIGGGAQLF